MAVAFNSSKIGEMICANWGHDQRVFDGGNIKITFDEFEFPSDFNCVPVMMLTGESTGAVLPVRGCGSYKAVGYDACGWPLWEEKFSACG